MNTTSPQAVRTVVVATDLSPASEIAVDQAAMLARRWDADLVLLHVFNDGVWATITAIYEGEGWGAGGGGLAREWRSVGYRADGLEG